MINQTAQTRSRPHPFGLLATLVTAFFCFPCMGVMAQAPNQITERMHQQIMALEAEKMERTPTQKKMDSQLILATRQRRDGIAQKDMPQLRHGVKFEADGRTKVDIDANVSEALLNAIRAAGGEIINSVPEENAVRAFLPVESAEAIAARPDVKFIRPASLPFSNTGSVNSQGDTTHQSAQARFTFGANGAGIKVAVLSTSINDNKNSLGKAVNSGDLPGSTLILQGQAGASDANGGEGLAMLEIVHDLAPAAQLYFATGFSGEAQMARNIRNLAASGCRIIIDDIGYFAETPFQDGTIAKAINAVSAAGVLYFSSAANSGNAQSGNSGTWEGNFKKGGFQAGFGEYHEFKPGVFTDVVTQEAGSPTYLFWSDPLGGSANDYDLYVFDSFGNLVSASNNPQQGTQDPIEFVGAPHVGEQIVIYKFAGSGRYLHLDTNRARLQVGTAGNTKGHNASGAANAFCVAAAPAARSDGGPGSPNGPFPSAYNSNSKVETFSSDGFRRIFFNANGSAITPGNFTATGGKLLIKPDITAADGVATTLPFGSGLNPFFGTSAAAPHAGAIAAQVLSRRPSATPGQVRQALNASAIDILAPGIDQTSGRGIVMALGAVQAINSSTFAAEEAAGSETVAPFEADGLFEPQ